MGCGCKKRNVISQPKKAARIKAQRGESKMQARVIKRIRRVNK